MAPQNPGIGLRYAGQIASSCRDRTGIGRSRLAQQPRAGKTERSHQAASGQQRRNLPDILDAESIGNRAKRLAHEKEERMQRQRGGARFESDDVEGRR
jgi:hypothetical protein